MKAEPFPLIVISLFLSLALSATPARPGSIKYVQPDGKIVRLAIFGDEHGHFITTSDGCAVVLDDSTGYYCYAYYDRGQKLSSGTAVGSPASAETIERSRKIPPLRRSSRMSEEHFLHLPAESAITKANGKAVRKSIILLAQFKDLTFYETHSREQFDRMINSRGYADYGATGSALDYFNDQFGDTADFIFDIGPIVTLSNSFAYYGMDDDEGNDINAAEAVAEACRLSDAEVNFSEYDEDGDGSADNVFVFYAGGTPSDGSASDNHIWPHKWNLKSAGINLELDGVIVSSYAMASELTLNQETGKVQMTGIGPFCHEYSHVLGLSDLYDTDYEKSGGRSNGVYSFTSIMDLGNYNNDGRTPPNFNCIERMRLGLNSTDTLHMGAYTLEPVLKSQNILVLPTSVKDELFLFECRDNSGWDAYCGVNGCGMLAYHYDASGNDAGYSEDYSSNLTAYERWELNQINCRPDHECAHIIAAKNPDETSDGIIPIFFPFFETISLTSDSHADFKAWDGDASHLSLRDIRKDNGNIKFSVAGPIVIDSQDIFQDAVILGWHTDLDILKKHPSKITWWKDGEEPQTKDVAPYKPGIYSFTIDGLSPKTQYNLSISLGSDDGESPCISLPFTTKAMPESTLPFIYLNNAARTITGAFKTGAKIPLRIFNAANTADVEWYMDNRRIFPGEDGYYTLKTGGTLKAVVHYKDMTTDIFIKTVVVK